MTSDQAAIARKNLDKRLTHLKEDGVVVPSGGWVRAIREALGMTTVQLARRLGVVQSRVSALERAEPGGTPSLKTLRQAAEALDCILVYAMVPRTSLRQIVREQAERRADAQVERLHHTMTLENQALRPDDLADERERLVERFINGSPRRLWDEP